MKQEVRSYCADCLKYLRGRQQREGIFTDGVKCSNTGCRSGFQARFQVMVPVDHPGDLSNPLIDATHDDFGGKQPGYRPSALRRFLRWIGIAGCLAITLGAADPLRIFKCVGCERDADGNIKRSKAKARRFLREIGWNLPTKYVRVDHIIPLACGNETAYDDLGNMQLQWLDEAAAKDRWERDARACSPVTQASFLTQRGQLLPNAHSRTTPASWVRERANQMKQEYEARVRQWRTK